MCLALTFDLALCQCFTYVCMTLQEKDNSKDESPSLMKRLCWHQHCQVVLSIKSEKISGANDQKQSTVRASNRLSFLKTNYFHQTECRSFPISNRLSGVSQSGKCNKQSLLWHHKWPHNKGIREPHIISRARGSSIQFAGLRTPVTPEASLHDKIRNHLCVA